MSPSKKKKPDGSTLGVNRKATFLYTIEETLPCGIALVGTEVKSVKQGQFSFTDAYVEIIQEELFLNKMHITPYAFGGLFNHTPERKRRLLAHKNEIRKWHRRVKEKGYTLIPLKLFLSRGRVKVEIGLCKGKKLHDKRRTIKERDLTRSTERSLKESRLS